MSPKSAKYFLLLLVVITIMACVFGLFSSEKPSRVPIRNVVQANIQPAVVEVPQEANLPTVSQPGGFFAKNSLETSGTTTNEEDFLSQIRSWARNDPESALAWGRRQPDGVERTEALTDACFKIAETDPARAVTLAEQFKLSKDAVLENLAQQWAGKDLTAAYDWISSQPEDDRRDALVAGMSFVWSQKEPLEAAQYVAQQIAPGPAQDEAVIMVLHQWALTDPAGAKTWVEQFPDGPLQNRAMNELKGIARYEQSLAQSK